MTFAPKLVVLCALAAPAILTARSGAAQANASCEPADIGALSGWDGVWATEGADAADQGLSGRVGGAQFKLMGLDAPWNDAGWARMAAMLKLTSDPGFQTPGWGFPMMMSSYSELKFVISPAETTIINQYRDIRSIYTDGRGHMPEDEVWPTNWGDSTGCWEGDTLVIDTVAVRYDPGFNGLAPPLSEEARFVERMRLVAPGRIESEITITDPVYLAEPWVVDLAYTDAGIDRLVLDAFDDRFDPATLSNVGSEEDALSAQLPPDADLGDAELDRIAGRYQLGGDGPVMEIERRGDRLFLAIQPGQPDFLPMFAETPLRFTSLFGNTTQFVLDASGKVTGFEGTGPDGAPWSGTRIEP